MKQLQQTKGGRDHHIFHCLVNLFLIVGLSLVAGCVPLPVRQPPGISITVNPDADAYVGQSDPDVDMGSKEKYVPAIENQTNLLPRIFVI
jgi:hypothetical protein